MFANIMNFEIYLIPSVGIATAINNPHVLFLILLVLSKKKALVLLKFLSALKCIGLSACKTVKKEHIENTW